MTARDVPTEWAELLVAAGLTDPRNGKRASMTQLAEAAGVHASTVGHAMYGTRQTTAETANKLAIAISSRLRGMDTQRVRRRVLRLINESFGSASPFVPHPDADLLDDSEQKVVNELIGLLARSKRRQAGDPEHQIFIMDDDPQTRAAVQGSARARREIEQDPDYQRETSQAATRRRHEDRQPSTSADDGERDDTAG